MHEILSDPVKTVMLVVLAALEVPAILFLVVAWCQAKREQKIRESKDRESDKQ